MARKHDSKSKFLKLQQQLEGKPSHAITPTITVTHTHTSNFTLPTNLSFTSTSHSSISQDTHYLRRDMTKIALLSGVAIAAQLILFFSLRNGLVLRGF